MKKFISLALVLVLTLTLVVGCGNQTANTGEQDGNQGTVVLKAGHCVSETNPYHLGMVKFKELAEEYSNGTLEIQIFPNNILGAEREMVEGMQLGTLDLAVTSTGVLSNFVPLMGIVDLPYLFRDRDHVFRVLDGEVGDTLLGKFESVGIVSLGWWENGFRHFTNSKKAIEKPEDVKGLKIRVMENPVYMAFIEALGGAPTPINAAELYTALQSGTVDGQENPIPAIFTNRFYEPQKYLSLSAHTYSPAVFHVSKATWDKLTDEQKEAIKKAEKEARDYERELNNQMAIEQIDQLKEKGILVNEVDKDAFVAACQPVHQKFENEFGKDLIDKIINTK
jgi:tripartite ATP-independent transporter DctP family solute receptor